MDHDPDGWSVLCYWWRNIDGYDTIHAAPRLSVWLRLRLIGVKLRLRLIGVKLRLRLILSLSVTQR